MALVNGKILWSTQDYFSRKIIVRSFIKLSPKIVPSAVVEQLPMIPVHLESRHLNDHPSSDERELLHRTRMTSRLLEECTTCALLGNDGYGQPNTEKETRNRDQWWLLSLSSVSRWPSERRETSKVLYSCWKRENVGYNLITVNGNLPSSW